MLEISSSSADTAVEKLKAKHGKHVRIKAHECDVADETSVEAAFSAVCSAGERVDILICNAGISAVGDILSCTAADLDRVYKVNVRGVFFCLKAGCKRMLADGKGRTHCQPRVHCVTHWPGGSRCVRNDQGRSARPDTGGGVRLRKGHPLQLRVPRAYSHAVRGRIPPEELSGREAEVFKTLSEWHPQGRMGRPEEVAALILYLVSDEAGFVTGAAYQSMAGDQRCRPTRPVRANGRARTHF